MATQALIISNTSPTVEVYRIIDGANTYILAQDGFSTNAPNTVSIQVDYSNFYERIASALEIIRENSNTLITRLSSVNTSLITIANEITAIDNSLNTTVDGSYANVMIREIQTMDLNIASFANSLNTIDLDLTTLSNQSIISNQHLQKMADHAEVERAINISDLKNDQFNEPGFDQFGTVSNEVKNPTNFS